MKNEKIGFNKIGESVRSKGIKTQTAFGNSKNRTRTKHKKS